MERLIWKNNAESTAVGSGGVVGGILSLGGTSLNLDSGGGTLFPSPAAGECFLLTIYEKNGSAIEENHEVVKVTARSADNMTIVRNQEGATYGYPTVAGRVVYVAQRLTALGMAQHIQTGAIENGTDKATPVDADLLPLVDSAASFVLKKLTWANLKATVKTYFDTLYQPLDSDLTTWAGVTPAAGVATFLATPSSANLKAALTDELGGASGKVTFSEGTLAVSAAKTLTATHTLTLAGTDGTTMTFPSTSATIARIDAANTFTGVQTFSGTPIFSSGITVTGAITATGNITAYFSDDRLKTKLGKIELALDKLCSLEGFYYEANETAQALGYEAVREVGISAQSVQAVLPEVVVPAPIDEKYLTVRYDRMIPLLIEAIKELREEVRVMK